MKNTIPMGTRSLLVGAHQILIHTAFLAIAWTRLYGFPWDPRLWLSFLLHDVGYWNKQAIDDLEGETHPEVGARIMGRLFGQEWHDFCAGHSRSYSRSQNLETSRLCAADKLAGSLEPVWLYLPRVIITGEINEYMAHARNGKYRDLELLAGDQSNYWNTILTWHRNMTQETRNWAMENARRLKKEPE